MKVVNVFEDDQLIQIPVQFLDKILPITWEGAPVAVIYDNSLYETAVNFENIEKAFVEVDIPKGFHGLYLQTGTWRAKREARLKIDDYKCVRCGTAKNLQVHHLTYDNFGGNEDEWFDLITLCGKCHTEVHINDLSSISKFARCKEFDEKLKKLKEEIEATIEEDEEVQA